MTLLVTGGAGFIGCNFIHDWLQKNDEKIINLDKLTYAGNLHSLESALNDPRLVMVRGDIGDTNLVEQILKTHNPRAIINFAAESHVDRSILGPEDFIQTNIVGTFRLLETTRHWWGAQSATDKKSFRFLHVSTDEVYGSLENEDPAFTEENRYQPNSPYSASKAASDHLVRSYFHTYDFPVLTTNCSNNYGPYQFPEKLIPLIILRALRGEHLPVYGDGKNIRDWLYVTDHCRAIQMVLEKGRLGEVYNIGGDSERQNIDVVRTICGLLDKKKPRADGKSYAEQITYVTDRPGHDRRYAINAKKIHNEIGWAPEESFDSGLAKTIDWYLNNIPWIENVTSGAYQEWTRKHYDGQ